MNYNSPHYSNKVNPHFRFSGEFKSPYISPPNSGQVFSPYSYSSPKQHSYISPKQRSRGGKMRYFNCSSSSSNGSPYNRNNFQQEKYYKNNRSQDTANISLYYDPSALENPWEELEKEWQEKLESENAEPSDTSSK